MVSLDCCLLWLYCFLHRKISVPASPSAEIRMRIGTNVYYVLRMVCGPCVLMIRSNSLIFFWFLEIAMVGSLILGVKNNPPLQMMRYMSLEIKIHEHGGVWWNEHVFALFCFSNYWTLLQLGWYIWETGVLGKLYYARSVDETEGGSAVDVFGKREYFASCTMYGPLTKRKRGWFSGWQIFLTEVLGKPYY